MHFRTSFLMLNRMPGHTTRAQATWHSRIRTGIRWHPAPCHGQPGHYITCHIVTNCWRIVAIIWLIMWSLSTISLLKQTKVFWNGRFKAINNSNVPDDSSKISQLLSGSGSEATKILFLHSSKMPKNPGVNDCPKDTGNYFKSGYNT